MKMIAVADLYDEQLDPATMDFITKPGKKCRTCIFSRQRVSVCDEVERLAKLAGFDLCDVEDVVYVQRKRDERRLTIQGE